MGFFGRLLPRRRSRVEAAFLRAIKGMAEKLAAAGREAVATNFGELCTMTARSAALEFAALGRDAGEVSKALDGISTDVVLFEVVSWFMSGV